MTEFKVGDKVRINKGVLEGQTGVVVAAGPHVTLVRLEDVAFGDGTLNFYTETLVSADEDHESLAALKLHSEIVNRNHLFKVTTVVDGIMYQSLAIHVSIIRDLLSKPPLGLYAVDYIEKDSAKGDWKTLWQDS